MSREYSFNLSVPLEDIDEVNELLEQARQSYHPMRISRKPDRKGAARFYLSFPFSGARPDLSFQEWFSKSHKNNWELLGPTHGRWGLL